MTKHDDNNMKEMRYYAYRCLLLAETLIAQNENWLPAEEGNENMIKEMRRKNLRIEN